MKKLLRTVAIISVFALAFAACSKKNAKNSEWEDYIIPDSDESSNTLESAQNALFDIPESPASNFAYELSEDNSGVKITAYKGVGEGSANCLIPAEIEGMPVTELASDMFRGKDYLAVLVMPDTVKSIIGDWGLCKDLKYLKAVKLSASLTSICAYMFSRCESLKEITIPESVTTIDRNAFYSSGLKAIYIPDSVTKIDDSSFSFCKSLKNVRFPPSLKTFSSSTFYCCDSLEAVDLPAGITEIGDRCFFECKSLSSVHIPDSVTKIGEEAFAGCESLTSLEIPNSVTIIEKKAFDKSGLISLEIPDSVTELKCTFGRCASLTTLRLPNSLEEIDNDLLHDVDHPYAPMKSLQSVNLPSSLKNVGSKAFLDLKTLTEVIIPDSLAEVTFIPINDGTYDDFKESRAFEGTAFNLAMQKQIKDLGYKGKFTK